MDENSKSNNKVMLICLIVCIVLLMCLGGFIVYDKLSSKDEQGKNNTTTNSSLQENDKINTTNNKTNSTNDNTTNTENSKPISIYDGNCLNESNYNYELGQAVNLNWIDVEQSSDQSNAVVLSINWDSARNDWNSTMGSGHSGVEKFIINNFSGKVTDIYFDVFGYDLMGTTILFLIDDGSVEYMPVIKCLESVTFKSYGKLSGVENITKFYHASAVPKNANTGAHDTILAQQANGNYYDLNSLLVKTGNFE